MLRSIKDMKGFTIAASDGEIGSIKELYFDDAWWVVRYIVVDTGSWLTGRSVLIPLNAVASVEWSNEAVRVNLTKQQIKNSPGIEADQPVSRQHEADLFNYYGYPSYWGGPFMWGSTTFTSVMVGNPDDIVRHAGVSDEISHEHERGEQHLRSSKEVIGYHIRATDDTVGHVEDFLFDEKDWSIQMMVVDTRNWWPGKNVLIAPSRIGHVSWEDQQIAVNITREEVENSPEFDPAHPPAGTQNDIYRRVGMPSG
jgi:uncharacterized protein YrrD